MNRATFAADLTTLICASGPRSDEMAPAGLPDWDDAPMTMNDPEPYALESVATVRAPETYPPREAQPQAQGPEQSAPESIPGSAPESPRASYVRARNPDVTAPMSAQYQATAFLDVMGELQLNLQMSLLCLGDSVEGVPYDRSAHAAAETLRTRIQELADLRDALNEVYLDAGEPPFAPLFMADAPLVSYLKGVYLWCHDVTGALGDLAASLRVLQPDWFLLRERLERAAMWYFDGLPNEIRVEMEKNAVRADFVAKIEEVFFAARFLAHGLEKRFG
jgi:hypothetical protein